MKREDIRACILRVGGTNCDWETQRCFKEVGVQTEIVHLNQMVKRRNLLEYDALILPGGFSYGDYVRAGAIWAKLILAKLGKELKAFISENRIVFGICNGFQVLVEAGLLPGFRGVSTYPEAALAINIPRYNCRWIHVKHENRGKCAATWSIPRGTVLRIPVAHGEGRFVFGKEKEKQSLERLYENDQMVFRYCSQDGEYAEGRFPTNPNGAFHDIAGICSDEGTIFGLMPHPERAFCRWQLPDWTRQEKKPDYGDGRLIFESVVNYIERKA